MHALHALLRHGADPTAEAADLWIPFTVAYWYGYFNACLALILCLGEDEFHYGPNLHDVGDTDDRGDTPCHIAVRPISYFFPDKFPEDPDAWERDRLVWLNHLLDGSRIAFQINRLNNLGHTPLLDAAHRQSPAGVVQCPLDHGADVNDSGSSHHHSALCIMVKCEGLNLIADIVDLLLSRRALVNLGYPQDALHVALHIAQTNGDYSIINFILQRLSGANFISDANDSKEQYLSGVVYQSYRAGRYAECRVLMQHGVKLDLDKYDIMRALDASLANAQKRRLPTQLQFYLDMLPSRLVTANEAMQMALWKFPGHRGDGEDWTEVGKLLFARPDFCLGPQTTGTTTLLHTACSKGAPLYIVQHLLDLGSDPNIFDKSFVLPLSHTINTQCTHIAEMLLKHGADPFKKPSPEDWDSHMAPTEETKRTPVAEYIDRHFAFRVLPQKVVHKTYHTPFDLAIQQRVSDSDCYLEESMNFNNSKSKSDFVSHIRAS